MKEEENKVKKKTQNDSRKESKIKQRERARGWKSKGVAKVSQTQYNTRTRGERVVRSTQQGLVKEYTVAREERGSLDFALGVFVLW